MLTKLIKSYAVSAAGVRIWFLFVASHCKHEGPEIWHICNFACPRLGLSFHLTTEIWYRARHYNTIQYNTPALLGSDGLSLKNYFFNYFKFYNITFQGGFLQYKQPGSKRHRLQGSQPKISTMSTKWK